MKEVEKEPLKSKKDTLYIPAMAMPSFRVSLAIQNKVERKILLHTWGGLGDQICTEPTLRYALKKFTDCEVSLAAERPELFTHLKFRNVFDLREVQPNWDKYLTLNTITPPDNSNLVWQFFSHLLTHCVDFTSMCALRQQLPNAEKEIMLAPYTAHFEKLTSLGLSVHRMKKFVVVHAGKHWQSKTFPKPFWDSVLHEIKLGNKTPILIGADTDDNRSTVAVETEGCLDLRNQLSVMETVALLHWAKVLLTNDSAPLHMAASGRAWIGFVATCKHPDFIMHWRKGAWAWRMQNFGKDGIWNHVDYNPNAKDTIEVENVGEDRLASWLPHPVEFAAWACLKTESD